MIDTTLLADGARALGVELSATQIEQFVHYANLLVDWNTRLNLTAITDPAEIVIKHFLDGLSVLGLALRGHTPFVTGKWVARHAHAVGQVSIPPGLQRVIDVGAGAGFPGLPIKIARPDVTVTLLEATRKKCDFLGAVVEALKLERVTIVNARAEEAGRDPNHREQYDVAIARAVAELPTLVEYLLPFVKVGGQAVAQKSKDVQSEVERAATAIATLGGRVKQIVPVEVPGLDEQRYLVAIEKVAATPEKYPRRAGTPLKKPLV